MVKQSTGTAAAQDLFRAAIMMVRFDVIISKPRSETELEEEERDGWFVGNNFNRKVVFYVNRTF